MNNKMCSHQVSSLYVHFPFCRHLCNYCDFYKVKTNGDSESFHSFQKLLEDSYQKNQELFHQLGFQWSPLETLYFGGGTPSLWGQEGAKFFKNFLAVRDIKFQKNCEFTLEVNPGGWTEDSIREWMNTGVNRFSIGIQSLNQQFINLLDRVHSLEESYKTLDFFHKLGENFSVDFMIGLPSSKEEKRNILAELKEVLAFEPHHISLYILTVKDHYLHKKKLPEEEWIREEFLEVSSFLRAQGLHHYEVSNFARPHKESQHNLRYWKTESVGALGPSATGLLVHEKGAMRYKWRVNSPQFEREDLTENNLKLEKFYMLLRTTLGLYPAEFFREDDLVQLGRLLSLWEERGYLQTTTPALKLSPLGFLMLDSLMDDIFRTTHSF